MNYMTLALFLIAIIGLSGMTWLFPVVSRILFALRKTSTPIVTSILKGTDTLTIIIPAHNEERSIEATLSTIKAAIQNRGEAFAGGVKIIVGADGCTDKTVSLATANGAIVYENRISKGKWSTLVDLIKSSSSSEWIALVDAGILWPENLLSVAHETAADKSVVGIAPSYANPSAGQIESALWSIERHFKNIETKSGGPVSVHGATVLYRTKELLHAIESVSGQKWFNDDVVLPLVLRAQNPHLTIRYLSGLQVVDQTEAPDTTVTLKTGKPRELGRRRRMVIGNIQWIRQLLTQTFLTNPIAALVAMRRVFRLLWAYWIGFAVLSLFSQALQGFSFEEFRQAFGLVLVCAVMLSVVALLSSFMPSIAKKKNALEGLWAAGIASLSTPFYLIPSVVSGASWK